MDGAHWLGHLRSRTGERGGQGHGTDRGAPRAYPTIDFALLRLFLEGEEWTNTQLAQAMPLAPPRISRTVTKLVSRGLVHRRRLRSDRRVVVLTLTEAGMALTQDLHEQVQAYDASLCDGVSDEQMETFRRGYLQGHEELHSHCAGSAVLTDVSRYETRSCPGVVNRSVRVEALACPWDETHMPVPRAAGLQGRSHPG